MHSTHLVLVQRTGLFPEPGEDALFLYFDGTDRVGEGSQTGHVWRVELSEC